MLSLLIWCGSMMLEVLLLVRGFRQKLTVHYPVFFGYISFVLLHDGIRYATLHWFPEFYSYVYWTTEFLGFLMGCWVVLEIYQVSLSAYPGTARMARKVLAFLFAMAIAKAFAVASVGTQWVVDSTALEVERALRSVQAAAIVALVVVFLLYAVRFGRNLRGILLGYGLFVGERVICLTFVPERGEDFWFYAYSASYLIVLGVWIAHLWSFEALPETHVAIHLEQQYQRIAAATQRRLQETRGLLRKAVR